MFLAAVTAGMPAMATDLRLGLPVDCTIGKECWVQQYPDRDPSPGVRDHACGVQTHDGHDGTDFRLRDTAAEAVVIAAAAGTVTAVRDGEPDRLMRSAADREAVGDRECGNGVLIAHDGDWETQYCHLRKGSVMVRPGDRVAAGQRIGLVGYSGMAAFPHVHLSVRRHGRTVDPFHPPMDETCGTEGGTLWTEAAAASLAYRRGVILRQGFASAAIQLPDLETGNVPEQAPGPDWPAMVAYVWAINLDAGDEITIRLDGPGDLDAEHRVVLDRAKAQQMVLTGRRRPRGGWPAGIYRAEVRIGQPGHPRLGREWQTSID